MHLTLGLLYLERGQHEKAIAKLASLVKEYPTEYRLAYLLGTAYSETGAAEKALSVLEGIPITADQFALARLRIGMILKKQQRVSEAIDSLRKAIRMKNDFPGLYTYLASLYEETKRFQEAEELLREGVRMIPNSVDLYYSFGVLFEKTDRFEESIAAMRTVLKFDPDHADALNFIGYMYADRGIHLDEAETLIKRALQLKPGSGYITDSLGWLYFRKNRLDEAIRYLKEASTQSEDETIFEHLGDAYARAGQIREAIEAYGKAYQINPESEPLKKKIEELRKAKQ